jgi:hypothetical protein
VTIFNTIRTKTIKASKNGETRIFELREQKDFAEICYAGDQTGVFKRQMSFPNFEAGERQLAKMVDQMRNSGVEIVELT